jgi:pyrroloquinoline quinone biosynthesis protein D
VRATRDARPRLALGCRLSDAPGEPATLLMPERAMRLNGPGLQVVQRCDGRHTVGEIVDELQTLYGGSEAGKIEQEIAQFLEQLCEKRAVDFA